MITFLTWLWRTSLMAVIAIIGWEIWALGAEVYSYKIVVAIGWAAIGYLVALRKILAIIMRRRFAKDLLANRRALFTEAFNKDPEAMARLVGGEFHAAD